MKFHVIPLPIGYDFPRQKLTSAVILSEISNPNGRIRQTGETDGRKSRPFFKVAVANSNFFSLWFLDLLWHCIVNFPLEPHDY
jgi:hypothetical protein